MKWSVDVQSDIYGTVSAVSADGTIYVSAGFSLVAVNSDGTEKWRKTLSNEQLCSSPSIDEDGYVYVGSTYSDYGYLHAFGTGEPKKIEIQQPESRKLYFFGPGVSKTMSGNTVIIGSVKVKVHVYSQDQIESVHFYVDGTDQYNLTKPPFEWNMNKRYWKWPPLMQFTIMVTVNYKGGCTWSDSRYVSYFHLRHNYPK